MASSSSGPNLFGASHGIRIENFETIMKEIDDALGVSKPPAIEYLFVCPYRSHSLFGIGLGSPYGHAAVRYTLPLSEEEKKKKKTNNPSSRGGQSPNGDYKSIVMNIIKNDDQHTMVNFIDAAEYLYGVDAFDRGAEQGGAYNRRIVSVRIEEWPDASVEDLDFFYRRLQRREHPQDEEEGVAKKKNNKKVGFLLVAGPALNWLRRYVPESVRWAEQGNCARWTSAGLVFADALPWSHVWPKQIWVNLFESHGLEGLKKKKKKEESEGKNQNQHKNVHVVVYEHIGHAHQTHGDGTPLWIEKVSPLSPLYNYSYFDLSKFADVIVRVPEGSHRAVVERQPHPLEPSLWRWRKTEIFLACGAALWMGRALHRRWTRPEPPRGIVTQVVHQRRLQRFLESLVRKRR